MRACLLLAFAIPLLAQFRDFAVTDDGRLYFVTNLRLRSESDQQAQSTIYLLTDQGFSRVASAPPGNGVVPPYVSNPFTSGDGRISGYAQFAGWGTPSCGIFGLPRTTIRISEAALPPGLLLQAGHVSRNGRYFIGQRFPFGVIIVDLETGHSWDAPDSTPPNAMPSSLNASIGNNGTALIQGLMDPGAPGTRIPLALWHPERGILWQATGPTPVSGVISPDARFIAYSRQAGEERELVLVESATGVLRTLTQTPAARDSRPTFSNDGTLLYLHYDSSSGQQPMIVTPDAEPRRLIAVPEGAQDATIAGGGHLAWILTAQGRLLRVRTADGEFDSFLPETPFGRLQYDISVPGSVVRVGGSGLSSKTEAFAGETSLP